MPEYTSIEHTIESLPHTDPRLCSEEIHHCFESTQTSPQNRKVVWIARPMTANIEDKRWTGFWCTMNKIADYCSQQHRNFSDIEHYYRESQYYRYDTKFLELGTVKINESYDQIHKEVALFFMDLRSDSNPYPN